MELILSVLIIIAIANAGSYTAGRLKLPGIIGLIAAGILLGMPMVREELYGGHEHFIKTMGNAGLFALMFLAGLNSSPHLLYRERRNAAVIAVGGFITPLILGAALFVFLGYSFTISLIMGICLSISAEATRAKVLMELGKIQTKVGSVLIGAGLVDDGIGMIVFLGVILAAGVLSIGELVIIAATLASFFLGMGIKILRKKDTLPFSLEKILSFSIVPFFFVSLGLYFEFEMFSLSPYLLITVLAAAIITKLAGAFVIKPFVNLNFRQLHLVGWAMNSRGAIEMAIAMIAVRAGLINNNLYSALIVMAAFTTFIFPFVINAMLKKYPDIME
ncbi:MAG: cation:proton antiporter, partial [Candidatus Goldiibacteriota bacterium]